MQEFGLLSIGNLFRKSLFGTDRFTVPLQLGQTWNTQLLNTPQNIWDTINNNEYYIYKTTPEVFIPVNKFATMFSNGVFVIKDYKTGEIIENHPLLKLLEQPHPLFNRNAWLMDIAVRYQLYGSCVTYKNKPSEISEFPQTLINLPNDKLEIKTTGKLYEMTEIDEIIEYYKINELAKKYLPSELIILKRPNPENPIKGLSVLEALQMPISNIRGAYGFRNTNIVKKGGVTLISATGKDAIGSMSLSEEDRKDLEKQFTKDYGNFDEQSPVKFNNKPVDVNHISYPVKDAMLFEEVSENMLKIIDAIGLKDGIFSSQKKSTFANGQTDLKASYQDCVIPFSELFCYAFNSSENLFERGFYAELDYSHLPCMQIDESEKAVEMKNKAEAIDTLVQAGYSKQEIENLLNIKIP
jgi:hypothetical protein